MLKQVALIAFLGMSASAMAGQWQVKVGGSAVAPTTDTTVSGLGVVKADSELAFTPSVEYFFNDNISAELLLAAPISHDVTLNGVDAVKLKHLPPTITAKYHLLEQLLNRQLSPAIDLPLQKQKDPIMK